MERTRLLALIVFCSIMCSNVCLADMTGFYEQLFASKEFHRFSITVLVLFPVAQLLDAFVQWSMSRSYARRPRALFGWLVLTNLLTPLLAIPFSVLALAGLVVFEGMIVCFEAWIIHRLCRGGPEGVTARAIGFRRALLASLCGNAASVLVGIGGTWLAAAALF